jgi:hypothetical protein
MREEGAKEGRGRGMGMGSSPATTWAVIAADSIAVALWTSWALWLWAKENISSMLSWRKMSNVLERKGGYTYIRR